MDNNNNSNIFNLGLSAEALVSLATTANVGIWNWHIPTGEITLNEPIVRLADFEMGEIPHSGNSRQMLTYEGDRDRVNKYIDECLSGERDSYQIEYRLNRKDGSIVSVSESAIVYERDEFGNAVRLAAMVLDLSATKSIEQRTRELQNQYDNLCRGTDVGELARQNQMLRTANSSAAMIVGGFYQDYEMSLFQALKAIGESAGADQITIFRNSGDGSEFFRRTFWETDMSQPEQYNPGNIYSYDDYLPGWLDDLKTGEIFGGSIEKLPPQAITMPGFERVLNGLFIPIILHGIYWGLIRVDSYDRERTFTESEAEILQSGILIIASSISRNEALGRVNAARDQAMASTKAKTEFLSRMSHEIRTPMNAVIGMTSIAQKAANMDKVHYCLEKIESSSKQLLSIINDVLDMSKIEADKFEITEESFDFDGMIQNVMNVVQVKLDEKHQILHFHLADIFKRKIVSDELRLSQVMINLLNNAIKFTPDFGDITLKIETRDEEDDKFRLFVEVTDTGVGISEEGKKKLFNSFEQADGSITRKFGGTGLGLAISKKIVNLMGGDITVDSVQGEGSTFKFDVASKWGEELPYSDGNDTIPTQLRVLVVDDAPDVREYFQSVLESFSQICDTAESGAQAVEMTKQRISENRPYDIYFVDWKMPGMNGGMTSQAIKDVAGEDAIIVMISVADWSDIEKEAKSYGINNYMSKPVLPSTLYNRIAELTKNNLIIAKTEDCTVNDWSDKRILLAEDIEINREIVMTVLEETGIKIDCAENGQVAVDMFSANYDKYDLILMDVQMPVLDGLSATREIRAMDVPRAKQIPIIAMTANAFKEDEKMSMAAGMDNHMSKPLEVDKLFEVLAKYL